LVLEFFFQRHLEKLQIRLRYRRRALLGVRYDLPKARANAFKQAANLIKQPNQFGKVLVNIPQHFSPYNKSRPAAV
jgi:hypothetical protein